MNGEHEADGSIPRSRCRLLGATDDLRDEKPHHGAKDHNEQGERSDVVVPCKAGSGPSARQVLYGDGFTGLRPLPRDRDPI